MSELKTQKFSDRRVDSVFYPLNPVDVYKIARPEVKLLGDNIEPTLLPKSEKFDITKATRKELIEEEKREREKIKTEEGIILEEHKKDIENLIKTGYEDLIKHEPLFETPQVINTFDKLIEFINILKEFMQNILRYATSPTMFVSTNMTTRQYIPRILSTVSLRNWNKAFNNFDNPEKKNKKSKRKSKKEYESEIVGLTQQIDNMDPNEPGYGALIGELNTLEDIVVKRDNFINNIANTSSFLDNMKKNISEQYFKLTGKTVDIMTPVIEEADKKIKEIQKRLEKDDDDWKKLTPIERTRIANKIARAHFGRSTHENKVIKFSDVHKYSSIHELMGNNPMLLILYHRTDNFGHWVCLIRNKNGLIYFNPYGTYIDKAIDHIPDEYKEESNQDFPHLLKLLSESPLDVFYNEYKLQYDRPLKESEYGDDPLYEKNGGMSQTCGRWCGYFMQQCAGISNSKTVDDFANPFLKFKRSERDEIITEITNKYLV